METCQIIKIKQKKFRSTDYYIQKIIKFEYKIINL